MDRYGYKGDVSFYGQNRFKAYYNGPAGCPAPAGLGNVRPVLSGNYVGAPGKRIMRQQTSREQDGSLFASLGVRMAGPRYDGREVRMRALAGVGFGDLSRADCNTLMTTAGALATIAGAAARAGLPPPPARRTGESTSAFETRLAAYRRRHGTALDSALALTTGGSALAATAAVCNLIDEAAPPPAIPSSSSSGPSAWELAMYGQSSSAQTAGGGVSTQTVLLGVGALAVAGGIAYFLLK